MRATVRSWGGPCVYCCGDIDYDGDPNAPRSFTVAHLLSVSKHPELAEEWSNIQGAAHRSCNSSAGEEGTSLALGLMSEEV